MADVESTPYGLTAAPPNPDGTPVMRHTITAVDPAMGLSALQARSVNRTYSRT